VVQTDDGTIIVAIAFATIASSNYMVDQYWLFISSYKTLW